MKIAIYGRSYREEYFALYNRIFQECQLNGFSLMIHQDLWEFIKDKFQFDGKVLIFNDHNELSKDTRFVLSIGGDGTLLNTIIFVRDSGIPILGFNTGRLGFLSSVNFEDVQEVFRLLKETSFEVEERSLICLQTKLDLFGNENFALNEVCIHRKDTSSMVSIHAYVNNVFLNTYWADGLIVATPTGSTAYSLSCGGPILSPDSRNFIVTPVSTHNLTVRPIVVPDSSTIRLKAMGRDSSFMVSLDSRSETIDSDIELNISKASFGIRLVKLPGTNFFNTIREKLMWGMDKRN